MVPPVGTPPARIQSARAPCSVCDSERGVRQRACSWVVGLSVSPNPKRFFKRGLVRMIDVRKIELENDRVFHSFREWQNLYLSGPPDFLIPNTEIWKDKRLILKINSLGCKGEELVPDVPVVGIFGDSTVFGVSMSPESWPGAVSLPGHQVLNVGVEGLPIERSLARFQRLSEKVAFHTVVLCPGWHNIFYGNTGEKFWRRVLGAYSRKNGNRREKFWRGVLDRFSDKHTLALCSIPTCLTEECKEKGVESLLCSDVSRGDFSSYFEYNTESLEKDYFNFWCRVEPTKNNVATILDGVQSYNAFIESYCSEKGHIFIDLCSFMQPSTYTEIPTEFFDVCHFRPRAYKKVGDFVARELMRSPPRVPVRRRKRVVPQSASLVLRKEEKDDDVRKNLYTLW